jgi:hypothetical protein
MPTIIKPSHCNFLHDRLDIAAYRFTLLDDAEDVVSEAEIAWDDSRLVYDEGTHEIRACLLNLGLTLDVDVDRVLRIVAIANDDSESDAADSPVFQFRSETSPTPPASVELQMEEAGSGGIEPATITLDNDQIKAWPSTWYTLIPAPGANKLIIPVAMYYRATIKAGYTNFGENSTIFSNIQMDSVQPWEIDALLNCNPVAQPHAAINHYRAVLPFTPPLQFGTIGSGTTLPADPALNAALGLRMSNLDGVLADLGDLTGGHADNTLKIIALYTVIDVGV